MTAKALLQSAGDGTAVPAGAIGEYRTSGQVSAALTGSGAAVTSLLLTPGVWLLSGQMCNDVSGSVGAAAYTIMAISTTSTSLSEQTGIARMTYAMNSVGGNGAGAGTISNYRVNVTSNTTYYLNAATSANHTCQASLTAVRIS